MAREFPFSGRLYGPDGKQLEPAPRYNREVLGEFVEAPESPFVAGEDPNRLADAEVNLWAGLTAHYRTSAVTQEDVAVILRHEFGIEVAIREDPGRAEFEILILCYREQIKAARNLREEMHARLEEIRPAGVEFRLGFQVKTMGFWPTGGTDVE